MRCLILILALLTASPVHAGPSAKRLLSVMNPTNYSVSSFETGTDGWTLSHMSRVSIAMIGGGQGGDGGSYGISSDGGLNTFTATKNITTAAGNISFWYRTSSTGTSLKVDGATAGTFGSVGTTWTKVSVAVTAGAHELVLTGSPDGIYDYIMIPVP